MNILFNCSTKSSISFNQESPYPIIRRHFFNSASIFFCFFPDLRVNDHMHSWSWVPLCSILPWFSTQKSCYRFHSALSTWIVDCLPFLFPGIRLQPRFFLYVSFTLNLNSISTFSTLSKDSGESRNYQFLFSYEASPNSLIPRFIWDHSKNSLTHDSLFSHFLKFLRS